MPKRFSKEYINYLNSPEWQLVRSRTLKRYGYQCAKHNKACHGALQVHHKTYKRLGHEWPEDLVALCAHHHKIADFWRKFWKRILG